MTDEQQWERYRKTAEEVRVTVTDEKTREHYEQDAQRLAGVFRESAKTPLDAAATVTAISRLAALASIQSVQNIEDYLSQCVITYAMAAGILADDEELNSQPEDDTIDPADFPGAYL